MASKQRTESRYHWNREFKSAIDTVSLKDWWNLFSYGIGNFWLILDVILSWIYSGLYIYMYYILGELAQQSKNDQRYGDYFYIYIGVVIGSSILIAINYIWNVSLFYSSSKRLHDSMVWKLLRAPMHFFDVNSIGTILTRFTKDIESLGRY